MKVEAARLAEFKLSIGSRRINQKVATDRHLSRDGDLAGRADDWVRLRSVSFARSARSTAAFVDLCGNSGVRLGGRYGNGFSHPGVARKYPATGRGRVHALAHGP